MLARKHGVVTRHTSRLTEHLAEVFGLRVLVKVKSATSVQQPYQAREDVNFMLQYMKSQWIGCRCRRCKRAVRSFRRGKKKGRNLRMQKRVRQLRLS